MESETHMLPSNVGKKWTEDEEKTLLNELDKNMNIASIAKLHNRTVGGIVCRQKQIAYDMFKKNMSMDEIIKFTKLNKEQIEDLIQKRQRYEKKEKTENVQNFNKDPLKNEIIELRNEIKELKNIIKEFVEILKNRTQV